MAIIETSVYAPIVAADVLIDRKTGDSVEVSSLVSGGGAPADITSDDITDATTVGKNVIKAADQAAARTAIGAGTSNLAIGTTATTAMAGNKAPTTSQRGGVIMQPAIADLTAAPTQENFNALLAALRAAGVLAA